MSNHIPDGYFAVADPDHPGTITYWRARGNRLEAWPARARYGPIAYRKDTPKERAAKARYLEAYFARVRAWNRKVRREIEQRPASSMARFAEFSTRCGNCGRALTDEKSKVLGLGPDCRDGLDEGALAHYYTPAVGMAHALFLHRQAKAATVAA